MVIIPILEKKIDVFRMELKVKVMKNENLLNVYKFVKIGLIIIMVSCGLNFSVSADLTEWFIDSGYVLREYVKDPSLVAYVTASSRWVCDAIVAEIEEPCNVLEIGAGCGTISTRIAEKLNQLQKDQSKEYRFDIVECKEVFYKRLEKKLKSLKQDDKIFLYKEEFGREWVPKNFDDKDDKYDVVVSTIPMTCINKICVESILDKILDVLKPGGVFVYICLYGARSCGLFRSLIRSFFKMDFEPYEKYKEKIEIFDNWINKGFSECRSICVLLNFLPLEVFVVKRNNVTSYLPDTTKTLSADHMDNKLKVV